jgi:glycopeptide antibiotics resistance protein
MNIIRLIINYIFTVYLFYVINLCNFLYKFDQTYNLEWREYLFIGFVPFQIIY